MQSYLGEATQMKTCRILTVFILSIFAATLFGCGGSTGSSGTGTGTISLGMSDSSTDKYQAIYVTIDEIQVNKNDSNGSGNSGWTTVAAPGKTFNLLQLVNGVTAALGDAEIEAGTYQQIRLIIGHHAESANNLLGLPHPYANYVILNDDANTVEELKIPSGFQTGIKLVHKFDVVEDAIVELVLDFDACQSVVETGNGKYLLKPTIKIIETADKTEVYGEVTALIDSTATNVSNALVSAQLSEGASATIVRSTLTSDGDSEGRYSMLLSPGQNYNIVVFSTQKVVDSGAEKMYAPACSNITVPSGQGSSLDFQLTPAEYGTISGEVTVNGEIDENDPPVVYISIYTTMDCGYAELIRLPLSPDPGTNSINYSFDMPAGAYDVVASGEGLVPRTEPVLVTPGGETSNVDFNMS